MTVYCYTNQFFHLGKWMLFWSSVFSGSKMHFYWDVSVFNSSNPISCLFLASSLDIITRIELELTLTLTQLCFRVHLHQRSPSQFIITRHTVISYFTHDRRSSAFAGCLCEDHKRCVLACRLVAFPSEEEATLVDSHVWRKTNAMAPLRKRGYNKLVAN